MQAWRRSFSNFFWCPSVPVPVSFRCAAFLTSVNFNRSPVSFRRADLPYGNASYRESCFLPVPFRGEGKVCTISLGLPRGFLPYVLKPGYSENTHPFPQRRGIYRSNLKHSIYRNPSSQPSKT